VIAQSPAYHDHQPYRLLLNFPDTTADGRFRRILVVARRPGGGPLTEPTAAAALAGGNRSFSPEGV
jgi:hypothetical protein